MTTVWQLTERSIYSMLRSEGWRRLFSGGFVKSVDCKTQASIGLNTSSSGKLTPIIVQANIGVRNIELENLVANCSGNPTSEFIASVMRPIGEIMPNRRGFFWTFNDPSEVQTQVDDMVTNIRQYGYPFIAANIKPEIMLETMFEWRNHSEMSVRIPALLFLMGRQDEAKLFIQQELERRADWHENYQQVYIDYQKKLIQKFS